MQLGNVIHIINVRIYLDMVFWPEYVGSWAEGFPPVHKINLGRLTQEDYKKSYHYETKIKKVKPKKISKEK